MHKLIAYWPYYGYELIRQFMQLHALLLILRVTCSFPLFFSHTTWRMTYSKENHERYYLQKTESMQYSYTHNILLHKWNTDTCMVASCSLIPRPFLACIVCSNSRSGNEAYPQSMDIVEFPATIPICGKDQWLVYHPNMFLMCFAMLL